jgi:DNA-binding transcriptional MerR regulator
MTSSTSPYTIEDLEQLVTQRLDALDAAQPNGQVSQRPDRRTLRYYMTLGLLDRPAEVRNRRAWYGERHVAQVLAVKRLQAAGLTLAEIQPLLVGLSTSDLEELSATFGTDDHPMLARLGIVPRPAPGAAGPTQRSPMVGPTGAPPAPAFWRRRPTSTEVPPPGLITGVPLVEGITLLVAGTPSLDQSALRSLRTAAAPLVAELTRLGLVPNPDEPPHPDQEVPA